MNLIPNQNVDTAKNKTILSICTGYGGLERGIESVLGECTGLAYVEIEAFAVANLVNKMETGRMDPVPIWTDLKTFDARPFRDCVDILTGGYPCQPFSAAGKRNGTNDPRHLWPYIRTIVMDCKPRQCFFENVEGHLTLGISEVLSDLEAMGYRSEVGIFSAAEVGAPHQRKRVFILGNSKEWCDRQFKAKSNDMDFSSDFGPGEENQWPSRPGEPQHEWEAPRVVADTGPIGQEIEELQTERIEQPNNTGQKSRKTKPLMGRTTNGTRNRVDRLRLLGNGVVRQTAAKAYYTLLQKI